MATYNTEIGSDIKKAAALLASDEVVGIPTETVYGLAGNTLREQAIHRIFAAKQRPLYNPLIVHVKALSEIEKYAYNIPALAYQLFERFSPGPLTLILPKRDLIPELITAGKPDVALRIPNHPLTLELLQMLDFPLAAPSANPFGYISPTTAVHVQKQLFGKIPYILDGGACKQGLESTVIGFVDGKPKLHRLGALSLESLQELIPDLELMTKAANAPVAPGMLSQHYSPNTRMFLLEDLTEALQNFAGKRIGIISLSQAFSTIAPEWQVVLSENGDLEEAASKLYAALHYLDSLQLDVILAERMPEIGLGAAMNDRLTRAAAKFV